jgi:hypothetical protein
VRVNKGTQLHCSEQGTGRWGRLSATSGHQRPSRDRSKLGCRPPALARAPLFRPVAKGGRLGAERFTDQSVCDIVEAHAERIGLKAADFGAAGFLTSAALGIALRQMPSGHFRANKRDQVA